MCKNVQDIRNNIAQKPKKSEIRRLLKIDLSSVCFHSYW